MDGHGDAESQEVGRLGQMRMPMERGEQDGPQPPSGLLGG